MLCGIFDSAAMQQQHVQDSLILSWSLSKIVSAKFLHYPTSSLLKPSENIKPLGILVLETAFEELNVRDVKIFYCTLKIPFFKTKLLEC